MAKQATDVRSRRQVRRDEFLARSKHTHQAVNKAAKKEANAHELDRLNLGYAREMQHYLTGSSR